MIYATSVFTHLATSWSRWLLELHRLLDRDGLLMVTHMGPGYAKTSGEEPWREDRIGMLVLGPGNPWTAGGPMVLHSEWWVRAHWGRCFEILSFEPDGFGSAPGTPDTQGLIVLRKREVGLTPAQLEALEPGETREIGALQHSLERSHGELIELNAHLNDYTDAYVRGAERSAKLDATLNDYAAAYAREAARSAELSAALDAQEARASELKELLLQAERPRNAARALYTGVKARLRS
jgi:hypothetical protein